MVCLAKQRQLCDDVNCTSCFDKSFASCEKSKFWSLCNTTSPRCVFKMTNTKYWFNCHVCGHNFQSTISHVTRGNAWCPYCDGSRLCTDLNCTLCNEKSFATHEKAAYWSDKNTTTPRAVFKHSKAFHMFDCPTCSHTFEARLCDITEKNRWCPFCAKKQLCDSDGCLVCFHNSFASSSRSRHWSKTNEVLPRQVFKASSKKFLFNCTSCKIDFTSTLNNVSSGGNWCPRCKNKTEKLLLDWLSHNVAHTVKHQAKFLWCTNIDTGRCLPYDFAIEDLHLIIELDGVQHWQQVSNWTNVEEVHKRDVHKMKSALSNGYSVIRIPQIYVFRNSNNWKTMLKDNIKHFDQPCVTYLSNEPWYDRMKSDMSFL